jgi:hypothetical protein
MLPTALRTSQFSDGFVARSITKISIGTLQLRLARASLVLGRPINVVDDEDRHFRFLAQLESELFVHGRENIWGIVDGVRTERRQCQHSGQQIRHNLKDKFRIVRRPKLIDELHGRGSVTAVARELVGFIWTSLASRSDRSSAERRILDYAIQTSDTRAI